MRLSTNRVGLVPVAQSCAHNAVLWMPVELRRCPLRPWTTPQRGRAASSVVSLETLVSGWARPPPPAATNLQVVQSRNPHSPYRTRRDRCRGTGCRVRVAAWNLAWMYETRHLVHGAAVRAPVGRRRLNAFAPPARSYPRRCPASRGRPAGTVEYSDKVLTLYGGEHLVCGRFHTPDRPMAWDLSTSNDVAAG